MPFTPITVCGLSRLLIWASTLSLVSMVWTRRVSACATSALDRGLGGG